MTQSINQKYFSENIKIEFENKIAYLTLARKDGREKNEFDPQFMNELINFHKFLDEDENVEGVILYSDFKNYFSNGLDPNYLLSKEKMGRLETFQIFFELLYTIYKFSKLHYSVMEGHSMAGGALLCACSDYRFMSSGRFCFPESQLGLPIPYPLLRIIKNIISPIYLIQATMEGKAFKTDEAKNVGLVDYIYEANEIRAKAKKHMQRLLLLPSKSLKEIKKTLRAEVIKDFKIFRKETHIELSEFLDSPEFVAAMKRFAK